MKRLVLFLCGLVALCGNVAAQEYPKNIVGIKAGYAPSWATSYGVRSSVRHGYVIGVSDEVLLSQKAPFYFEAGLNYIAKGYEINGFEDSSTSFNYLQLPLGVNYHFRLSERVNLKPAAGFYYAYGLGGKRVVADQTAQVFSDGSTSRHDLGFSFGVGATIDRFHLGIAYETGLLNIDKADMVYGDSSPKIGYKNLKNKSVVIKLGVNF